jgi:nucleoside-diphosphate-sugar epimerase
MKVFITGITGYLGGSLACHFHKNGAHITGLVRGEARTQALEAAGFKVVVGDLEDGRLLSATAAQADVVINAASSDNTVAAAALIEGLLDTGKTLIHTSGSSLIADDARGEPSEKIYDESSAINPLPQKLHRLGIDNAIRESANRGVRSIVLCNSLIYGEGLGIKKDSIQVPFLVNQARQSKACYIGKGENITSAVHIEDVVNAYHLTVERGKSGAFYFIESDEASFGDMVRSINQVYGREIDSSWTLDEASKVLGNEKARFTFGSNTRMRGVLMRNDLGWEPTHDSVLNYIKSMNLMDR